MSLKYIKHTNLEYGKEFELESLKGSETITFNMIDIISMCIDFSREYFVVLFMRERRKVQISKDDFIILNTQWIKYLGEKK